MADLIRWFHDLEPVERTAAMAIIDDEKFVTFYMNLLRDEQQQSKSGASHALFMIDYLESLYEKASKKKAFHSKEKQGNITGCGAEQTAERPSSSNDSSLLSFLSSGRVTGDDTSDFDDPYCMPLIAQNILNRFPSCSTSCRGTEFTPSSSAYLSAEDSGTPTDNSECSRACPGNLGLRSNEFEMNDSALKNESTMKGEEPSYRRTNGCLNDNFGLAADLHLAATTSFATSGSGAFDSLFIMRPTTEDSHRLIAIFEELSNSRMFSIRPTFEEIKDSFKGSNKSLPMIGWLAEILRPKEVGINPSSVSYYVLLLSRIELSLWHTFYTSTGCAKPSPSSSIIPICGNTDVDDEFNTVVGSFNNSVTLLPRARGSKKSKSLASNRAVPVPVRNSMRVLEISSLQRLSCTAVMLTLGCIIEEHKASWRKMSKVDMLAILSDFPAASTFYSNPTNVRGRSETVVDRLILCPLLWIVDTIAEQEVKIAYRHMEAVITGNSRISNSSSSSSSSIWNPHARDSTDLTGIPRLGLRSFDENASRTGAMGFILPSPTSSGPVPVEALKESVVEGENSRVTEHQAVRATPVGLSKRNVVRPVLPIKPTPEIAVPIAADAEEEIERDKNLEVADATLPPDSRIHPPIVENDTALVGHTTGTGMVTEEIILVSHLAEFTELASSSPLVSCPPSKKALKSIKAKAKASAFASQLIKESDIETVLESGNESPLRDEMWNAWPSNNDTSTVVQAEKDPSPVTIDSFISAPTEPTGHLSPSLVTALEGFDPLDTLDDALREGEVPTPVLDDVCQLEIMSRNTDDVGRKCLSVECNPTPIVTPIPQSHATLQHPYHNHPSLTADQDSVYYESARNSRRGTPDTSDIINALEGYQGTHEEDYESAFLSARISGKERRGSRDSNDSYLTAQRSKKNPKSNRQNNSDVLYATYHSGKDSPPRQHIFNNDGSVADYRSNRKVPSIGIVTGGPLFSNRRTPTDRGISSSSSSSIGSFSPADMGGDDRAGNYMGQEDSSPVNKKDYYSISSDDRNRDRHQHRTNVPELWHLRFDPNSPSQSPRTGNPTSFAVPFGPGGSKSPVSLGSSSPTGIFVDCRPRSRPSTPREELWSHNNVIHHLSSRSMESIGGSQGQVRVQNQNQNQNLGQGQGQSGYGHGLVLTPDRPGRINYESRRYDQNQHQHQHQQPSHHHHHQMNGNNSNIINNNINSVYNQNNCYNGKINNNNSNNNSHNNNGNINNGNLNFNDFNYITSHQFENNNDQRNRQQIARCRSGPYRGMPTNPRENKDMEFKMKSAQRLQKLLTKNIRSFNNIMSGRMDVHKLVRIAVFLELRSMVLSLWPTAVVRIFGSCVTGLALPSSDIDIVIQLTRQQQYRPQYANNTPYQNTAQPALYYQGHRSKPPAMFYQYAPPLSLQQPTASRSEERGVPGTGSGSGTGAPIDSPGGPGKGGRSGTSPCPTSIDSSITQTSECSSPTTPRTDTVDTVMRPSQSRSSSTDTETLRDTISPALTRSPTQCPTPQAVDIPPGHRSPLGAPSLPDGALHYISVMGFPVLPPAPPSQEMFNSLFFALTSQLYMQIWASQVNPIPSATVPVIKFRVAADALLSNPIVQQAVFLAHQQQLLSPILEPAIFPLPVINPVVHARGVPGPHHEINPHLRFPSCFTSTSPITAARDRTNTKASKRDRAQSTSEEGSISERPSTFHLRHNSSDSADAGMNWAGLTPQGVDQFDGIAPPMPPQFPSLYQQQLQQQQQQQQQQQHMFLYTPQSPNAPFTIGGSGQSPNHPPDHGQSILGGQGKYPPPFVPPTPFFALLPFHLAAGVSIAVDLTIEAGQHEGLSSSDFVQQTLSTRSAVLPAVVKVVKALLVQSKFNVPFSGGLSSYSAFLLVLAAYDRCQYSDMAANMARRGGHHSWSHGSNLNEVDGGLHGTADIESGQGYGSSGRTVSEGEVLIHFLALYSTPNVGFQSSSQGIDVRAEPSMLCDLNPDQQASIAGGGLWIVDPRDPSKNVARPTFAFKQAQQYFKLCLDKIESAAATASLNGSESSSVDFLKLLIRY